MNSKWHFSQETVCTGRNSEWGSLWGCWDVRQASELSGGGRCLGMTSVLPTQSVSTWCGCEAGVSCALTPWTAKEGESFLTVPLAGPGLGQSLSLVTFPASPFSGRMSQGMSQGRVSPFPLWLVFPHSPYTVWSMLRGAGGSQEQGCFVGMPVSFTPGTICGFCLLLKQNIWPGSYGSYPWLPVQPKINKRREHLESDILFTKQNGQVLTAGWGSTVASNPPELTGIHFIELGNDWRAGTAG